MRQQPDPELIACAILACALLVVGAATVGYFLAKTLGEILP